jgi:hypothetical protein
MATGISMAAITALSGPFYEALGPLAFATMMLPPVISVAILVLLKRGKGPFSPKAPVAGA